MRPRTAAAYFHPMHFFTHQRVRHQKIMGKIYYIKNILNMASR
jgi:hypothetical protein